MISSFSSVLQESISQVVQEIGFTDIRVRENGDVETPFNISVSVGVAGSMQGFLFYRMVRSDAISIAHELGTLMGITYEDPTALTEMHKAALTELANQISGRMTILLSNEGVDTDITPPTILTGDGISFNPAGQFESAGFLMDVPQGTMSIVGSFRHL